MMRRLLFGAMILLSANVTAQAYIVHDLPHNGTIDIVGDIAAPEIINFHLNWGSAILPPPPNVFADYLISVQVTTPITFGDAGNLVEYGWFNCPPTAPTCGRSYDISGYVWISDADRTITISSFIRGDAATDNFEIYAGLPDGLTISAVPEPSIWAMLLIGFSGIGFASFKRKIATKNHSAFI
jgi:hypothetical protein